MRNLCTEQVPASEIYERREKIRDKMEKNGISAYICFNPDNIYYLTNFANFVHERPFILILTATDISFIIPRLERDHVERHKVGSLNLLEYAEFPATAGHKWSDRLIEALPPHGRIGIEAACPASISSIINNPVQIIDLVDKAREIKSLHEIARIAWVSDVMTGALKLMLGSVKKGSMVAEAISGVSPYIYQRSLTEVTHYNVMASKAAGLIQPPEFTDDPHNFSCLTARCQSGGPFVSLIAGRINGYGSEIERTFFLDYIPEEAKQPFDTMMAMRHKAFEMLRPGAIGSEIDAACQNIALKAGYDVPLHRTGHSFGVTGHEAPFLAVGEDNLIKPGMVFSIEPGIYIKNQSGFRHSDTVLVTETGCVSLTHYPDAKEELVIG